MWEVVEAEGIVLLWGFSRKWISEVWEIWRAREEGGGGVQRPGEMVVLRFPVEGGNGGGSRANARWGRVLGGVLRIWGKWQ